MSFAYVISIIFFVNCFDRIVSEIGVCKILVPATTVIQSSSILRKTKR